MSGVTTQLDQAVVHLRELILRGKLAPGQRVAEAPLAEELGMSRTPVRRALPVLAREGLLTEHETRGYVVRGFTWAEVVDAIELRGMIEGLVARRIAEHGVSRPFLRELKTCLDEGDAILRRWKDSGGDEAGYADMNMRFHTLLHKEGGSSILLDALERNAHVPFAGPQAVAFDHANPTETYELLRYAHRQHHAVAKALERGESARVEALMREHANTVKESIHVADFEVAAAERGQRVRLAR